MNDRAAQVATALAAGVSPDSVRPGTVADAVDGIVPHAVVAARTEREVAALIGVARTRGLRLVVRGGGTLLAAGNAPRALDAVIDTRAMSEIVERCPEDMTVTVRAGTILAALARALKDDSQRLAIDLESPERATVGGTVAANAGGALTYGFPAPRDLVLGMTVVDGAARTLKLGGRVVKNVAGYDLVRLFGGSFGTLGVITELTLRTHPLPEDARTLEVDFARVEAADGARAAIFRSELPLAAFDYEATWQGDARHRLVLRLEGTHAEIDYQTRRCVELCAGGRAVEATEWRSPWWRRDDEPFVLRLAVMPDRVVQVIETLRASCAEAGVVPQPSRSCFRFAARLGDGALRVFAKLEDHAAAALVHAVRNAARDLGSNAVVERACASVKSRIEAWGEPPGGFAIMRELKKRFDPDGVLAPGRFVGGI